ncbi:MULTISPECIES: hypothetical protein [unclassified Burkholderia]|uniref:hypothetical protein n=1 Tax=unclassified Burkholderia TaxID=2613784 RepID=UPI000F56DFDC|nr:MULTISPECIES: hypothetical protein [unclassified Burkholderia]RQR89061.1 hypothetical protein DIE10_04750 [Burkholderia sp. Bp9011]RQR96553.1 hypothetical protein DIE02_31625 [Burkholderia sp. Bp8991]RQR98211.1 hypothetical protein DIE09_04935 [Burkholderia sp. Bp9010]RQS66058.1 hypothetical protein DID97_30910 [Burkholderia sp. Bp8977]
MSEADDRLVLATLARLKRVREMRSQIARVAAARQQGIAAQSRRALDAAHAQLAQQVAAKAAIQTRLADDVREARALQNAAADTRTFDRHIGVAHASVSEAAHLHRGHEATLADLQRAARKAKAAEDKLDKAGEKALQARAARVERDADEVADAHAVRRFATAGVWAGDAQGHASGQRDMAAAFDAEMVSRPAGVDAMDAANTANTRAAAGNAAPGGATVPAATIADPAPPAAAERRC